MADPKRTYQSKDAEPVVLYAKRSLTDEDAWPILVNTSGLILSTNSLGLPAFDFVSMVLSPSTTETYSFRTGGSSGTLVATVVVVYTSAARSDLSTVTKS